MRFIQADLAAKPDLQRWQEGWRDYVVCIRPLASIHACPRCNTVVYRFSTTKVSTLVLSNPQTTCLDIFSSHSQLIRFLVCPNCQLCARQCKPDDALARVAIVIPPLFTIDTLSHYARSEQARPDEICTFWPFTVAEVAHQPQFFRMTGC